MSTELLIGLLVIGVAVLMFLYGQIQYREGIKNGYVRGCLKSTAQLLSFLEEVKVIRLSANGDIYRVDDNGNSANIVFDSFETIQKLNGSVKFMNNKVKKELDSE